MRVDRMNGEMNRMLLRAKSVAGGWGHSHVGSEHLLLGLLREEAGAAHRCLAEPSGTAERARAAVIDKGEGEHLYFVVEFRSQILA